MTKRTPRDDHFDGEFALLRTPCVYCGDPGNTRDHLYPRTWTGDGYTRTKTETVPACHQCNSIIGDRCGPNVDERRDFAQASIRARYGKYLQAVNWELEDLAEMGVSLRSHICAGLIRKRWIESRLAWPGMADWMLDPDAVAQMILWSKMQMASDEDALALSHARRYINEHVEAS